MTALPALSASAPASAVTLGRLSKMMPITPIGVRTRSIWRPFGRSHSAMVVPTGSGSAAISSSDLAIPSTRAGRACRGRSAPWLVPARLHVGDVLRVREQDLGGLVPANLAGGGAKRLVLRLGRRIGEHRRGGARARPMPSIRASTSTVSAVSSPPANSLRFAFIRFLSDPRRIALSRRARLTTPGAAGEPPLSATSWRHAQICNLLK